MRWSAGTLPTDFGFTGQRDDAYIKLTQMGARWYDPQLGRWISADTIVPSPANPQTLNRYSYVNNQPLVYTDPTGHYAALEDNDNSLEDGWYGCIYLQGHAKAGHPIYWTEEQKAQVARNRAVAANVGTIALAFLGRPEAAAMIKLRLLYGLAGGAGAGVAYTGVSLWTGDDFDVGEFFAAVTIGSLSGAFPDVGGPGIGATILRGAGANEAQYILGSLLSGKGMSIEEHAISVVTGGIFGFFGDSVGGGDAFNTVKQNVDDYAMRVWSGASSYAGGAVRASLASARVPAVMEGVRTALLEWGNNIWQAIATDLTTDYSP